MRVVIYPALIRPSLKDTLYQKAEVAILSVAGTVLLTFLFSMALFRALGHIGKMLDRFASGEFVPEILPADKKATDELSVMASKVNLLGQRLRGAQVEVSDLRGNIDRLLQDLEDAVFVFNRERRLIFASGSVEKFLGKERAWFSGQALADVFPPASALGLPIERTARTGHPVTTAASRCRLPRMARAAGRWLCFPLTCWRGSPAPWEPAPASWFGCAIPKPSARSAASFRPPTAWPPSAASPAAWLRGEESAQRHPPARGSGPRQDVARRQRRRPQMEIISREIVRLDRVVKTFLDFTKPVDLNFSNLPLRDLMDEIAQLARPQAEAANIRVDVRLEEEGVEVRADRDMLKQAILNVVMNAMEAMPEGGELRLEALAGEDAAELRISDTGGGISPELREKISAFTLRPRKRAPASAWP